MTYTGQSYYGLVDQQNAEACREFNGDPGLIVELVSDIRESIDYAVQNAFSLSERDRVRIHGCLMRARAELWNGHDVRTVQPSSVKVVREDHE